MPDNHTTDDLALFPGENPNPILRVAADGTILFANRASDPLLAFWKCARGTLLPPPWRGRVLDVLKLGTSERVTVLVGSRLYEFDFVPILGRGYANIYGREISRLSAYQSRLWEDVNDAILAFDQETRITAWNRRAEELYGWKAGEVLGAYLPEAVGSMIPEDERAAIVRAIKETGRWQGEVLHTRRDGTPILVEVTSLALRDDAGLLFAQVEVSRDITARRRAELAVRQQSQRLEMLHEIDLSILAARAPAEIAGVAVAKMQNITKALRVTVVLCDPAGQQAEILAESGTSGQEFRAGARVPLSSYPKIEEVLSGRVVTIPNMADLPASWPPREATLAAGILSATLVPLMVEERVIGLLTISRSEQGALPAETLELALEVANSLAVALYNAQLAQQVQVSREQLQGLSHRLVQLQETERSQVARELYDDEGQRLAAALIELELIEKSAQPDTALGKRIGELKARITDVLGDMHDLAVSLRPASLDRLGLIAAVSQFAEDLGRQFGLEVNIETGRVQQGQLSPLAETTIYRIAQEALSNAARHAHAAALGIVATQHDQRLVLVIEDDGHGFDVSEARRTGRLGLLAMSERAEMIGGRLTIESTPGAGTAVYIEAPLNPTRPGSDIR